MRRRHVLGGNRSPALGPAPPLLAPPALAPPAMWLVAGGFRCDERAPRETGLCPPRHHIGSILASDRSATRTDGDAGGPIPSSCTAFRPRSHRGKAGIQFGRQQQGK